MRTGTGTFYATKVRYQKTMDNGCEKMVTEQYLVDALSFTEAEMSITEEMSVYISGEFGVSNLGKATYHEIFFSDIDEDDKWYKAKLSFITLDEKTGKEKRNNVNYLVQAKSLARALRYIEETMDATLQDYDVVGISLTSVMDVFEHHKVKQEATESKI